MSAPTRWYSEGFALGAAGAKPTQRTGRPRLKAMLPHWKAGVRDGAFARSMFVGAYDNQAAHAKTWP